MLRRSDGTYGPYVLPSAQLHDTLNHLRDALLSTLERKHNWDQSTVSEFINKTTLDYLKGIQKLDEGAWDLATRNNTKLCKSLVIVRVVKLLEVKQYWDDTGLHLNLRSPVPILGKFGEFRLKIGCPTWRKLPALIKCKTFIHPMKAPPTVGLSFT